MVLKLVVTMEILRVPTLVDSMAMKLVVTTETLMARMLVDLMVSW
jgi:hypothetical protein